MKKISKLVLMIMFILALTACGSSYSYSGENAEVLIDNLETDNT